MNCFDWRNRTSDYLDGALIESLKREADEHLEKCDSCGTYYKHCRLILTSIASQPRASLPIAIRKAPLSAPLPRGKIRLRDALKLWSLTPWFVKIPLESAAIVLLISVAVSAVPRVRRFYENKMERSLTEYAQGFGSQDLADDSTTGLVKNTAAAANPAPQHPASANSVSDSNAAANSDAGGVGNANDDFAGGDGGEGDSGDSDVVLKAGKGEIWRFNLKTDSPTEVRTKIVAILAGLKLSPSTPGINGLEVPGGIQFDLMLPQAIVPKIKAALEKIAPVAPKDTEDTPLSETFTWYKSRSKRPIPAGKTHVVIWLSQI